VPNQECQSTEGNSKQWREPEKIYRWYWFFLYPLTHSRDNGSRTISSINMHMHWVKHVPTLLPPTRRLCFRRCLSVCLLATLRKNFQTDLHEIFREGWPVNKWLNFDGDADHCLDTIQGLFSVFVIIGRYGKWSTDINLLLILIRQMAALVRRTLAEVCTVPVLLVFAMSLLTLKRFFVILSLLWSGIIDAQYCLGPYIAISDHALMCCHRTLLSCVRLTLLLGPIIR